jgi:membrane protease YdiL (CAAX protease family)
MTGMPMTAKPPEPDLPIPPEHTRPLELSPARRMAVLAAPIVVPVTMSALFRVLAGRLGAQRAYNAGFAVYWLGWCTAFPLLIVGGRRAAGVLTGGRRPRGGEAVALALPAAGAIVAEFLPNRHLVDRRVGAAMALTAGINAVGEELLWRGLFLTAFPGDSWRSTVWPLGGFVSWHLAPQQVLPSRHGRAQFLLGAAAVGGVSSIVAKRAGLRWVLLSHALTDACGVTAACFRLGLPGPVDADS